MSTKTFVFNYSNFTISLPADVMVPTAPSGMKLGSVDVVAAGGEGLVVTSPKNRNQVLKIYHKKISDLLIQKIRILCNTKMPDRFYIPKEVVLNGDGNVQGYSMAKLPDGLMCGAELLSDDLSLSDRIDLLVAMGQDLEVAHRINVLIPDMYPANFWMNVNDRTLHWLDCTSWAIDKFPATAFTEEIVDPRYYATGTFTKETDSYSFAYILWSSLNTATPFVGVPQSKNYPGEHELKLRKIDGMWMLHPDVKTPKKLDLVKVDPESVDFFRRIFQFHERPNISMIMKELDRIRLNLTKCGNCDREHSQQICKCGERNLDYKTFEMIAQRSITPVVQHAPQPNSRTLDVVKGKVLTAVNGNLFIDKALVLSSVGHVTKAHILSDDTIAIAIRGEILILKIGIGVIDRRKASCWTAHNGIIIFSSGKTLYSWKAGYGPQKLTDLPYGIVHLGADASNGHIVMQNQDDEICFVGNALQHVMDISSKEVEKIDVKSDIVLILTTTEVYYGAPNKLTKSARKTGKFYCLDDKGGILEI